jgi:hypothetical protein
MGLDVHVFQRLHVRGLSDDLEVGFLLHERSETLAKHRLVIDEREPNYRVWFVTQAVVSFARQGAQLPSLSHVPGALVDVRVSFLALTTTKKCRMAGESGSLYEIGPMTVWQVVFAYNENGRSVDSCRHFRRRRAVGFRVSVRQTASPGPDGLSGPHSSRTHVVSSVVTSGDL